MFMTRDRNRCLPLAPSALTERVTKECLSVAEQLNVTRKMMTKEDVSEKETKRRRRDRATVCLPTTCVCLFVWLRVPVCEVRCTLVSLSFAHAFLCLFLSPAPSVCLFVYLSLSVSMFFSISTSLPHFSLSPSSSLCLAVCLRIPVGEAGRRSTRVSPSSAPLLSSVSPVLSVYVSLSVCFHVCLSIRLSVSKDLFVLLFVCLSGL